MVLSLTGWITFGARRLPARFRLRRLLFAGSLEGAFDQPVRPVQIAMKATTSRAAGDAQAVAGWRMGRRLSQSTVTGVENTPFFQDSASPGGSQPTVCRAGYITFLDKCCESRFVRQGDIGGGPSGKCSQKRQIVQRHSLPFAAHARRSRLLLLHVPLKSRNRIFLA